MSKSIDKEEKADLEKSLEALGLSAKEASVYLALTELGQVGSSKIIQATDLHGQFVYAALASLEDRGLATHTIQNGRKKFSAASPKRISNLIQNQALIAEEVVKKLEQMARLPEKQSFEVLQGDRAYVDHEFEQLRSAPANSTLCIFGGQGDDFARLIERRKGEYEKLRKDKKIRIRYIGSEAQKAELAETHRNRFGFDYRIIPGFFAGMVNTDIWTDRISFNVFGEPVMVFHLMNKDVAESYRTFFEAVWGMGRT